METKIRISHDWENDGMLVWENAQTIELYKSLKDELRTTPKGFEDEIFFAFTNRQFEEGMNKLPEDAKNLKIYQFGGGCFGTKRAIDAIRERDRKIYRRIETGCDPQEVYYYEYNNHECCIGWDGDSEAIYKVMCYFGDVAKTVKRMRDFYTIDEVKKRMEA